MRKLAVVIVLMVAVLAATFAPGYAHGRWRGGVYFGVGPYWGPYPYYWYPPPYYIYRPPAVVVEEPPVYIERPPASPPPAPAAPTAYWYYCESAKGYYPTVPSCAEEWIKVPERPR